MTAPDRVVVLAALLSVIKGAIDGGSSVEIDFTDERAEEGGFALSCLAAKVFTGDAITWEDVEAARGHVRALHGGAFPPPPLSVYVCGSSDEIDAVRTWIDRVKERGARVTYDWTTSEGYRRPLTDAERREQARIDLDAVRSASVVWLIAPAEKSEGSHAELGAALVLGKRVIVSGPHAYRRSRLFADLAERYQRHEDALEAIFAGIETQWRPLFDEVSHG